MMEEWSVFKIKKKKKRFIFSLSLSYLVGSPLEMFGTDSEKAKFI